MDEFFTRQHANEGVKLPLSLPDGTPTEHYITIRGVDSDAFRMAEAVQNRKAASIAAMDEPERLKAIQDSKNELLASLVIGWSFDKECTTKNVVEFLTEAPQIADQIDTVAGRRALFFALKRSSLYDSPKVNGDSPRSPRGRKPA